jgi:mono/diheme cytochrome c family protein
MRRARVALGLALAAGLAAAVGVHLWRARGVSPVQRGHDLAAAHGCFGCHGPGGLRRFEDATAAALGDVPPFTRDADELREWILDGSPRRLRANPLARFFLARQAVQMPAYRGRIADGDVAALVAYIRALREAAPSRHY